jgi:hypothetical protein
MRRFSMTRSVLTVGTVLWRLLLQLMGGKVIPDQDDRRAELLMGGVQQAGVSTPARSLCRPRAQESEAPLSARAA